MMHTLPSFIARFPKANIFAGLFAALLFSQSLSAQVYFEDTYAGETSICASKYVDLRQDPGPDGKVIGQVNIGEELEHLGKEAFVVRDGKNYVKIKTADGSTGWADDEMLVRNGGLVVLTKKATIYEKPNTTNLVSGISFEAGEVVILSRNFTEDWVHLTGEEKEKMGWIKGYQNLSIEPRDIRIGALYRLAMMEPDLTIRRANLEDISQTEGFMQSEIATVITDALRDTYYATGGAPQNIPGTAAASGSFAARGLSPTSAAAAPSPNRYSITVKEVVDMETGKSYERVEESGSVQPVKAKNPQSIYYCYHKTLPIGSKVLLKIPGDQGYVQLDVVAPLRGDNPHMIGLGTEVLQNLFSVNSAKEIKSVTIVYPRKK